MAEQAFAAIVVAGGTSQRMGFDKLRADLRGKLVYLHSLQTLQDCPEIGQIILVASAKNLSDFQTETSDLSKVTHVIPGGDKRHFSVAIGLENIASGYQFVAVHDAARPLLSPRDLMSVLEAARDFGSASLATPVVDTLKRTDAAGSVMQAVDRENLWAMQTPQVFRVEQLRAAYRCILEADDSVTDEVSAVAKMGEQVKLVAAQDSNFKITYSCDIALARLVLTSLTHPYATAS